MLKLNHKNLDVWKDSIQFVAAIYAVTESFPSSELYGLTNQMRRAAVSVASNIAEGASRSSIKDRRRFYEIARSSLVEIDTQLEICVQLKFISENKITGLSDQLGPLFAMTSNLVNSTR